MDFVSSEISKILNYDSKFIALIGSPILTNEELYLLKKLGSILDVNCITSRTGHVEAEKIFGLISSDPFPNSTGVRDILNVSNEEDIRNLINSLYEGKIKALYTIGEDLFQLIPEMEKAELTEALSKLSLLIVQDFKLNETAKLAHVILPGATPYEKGGTYTNDQGRVQRIKKSIQPPGSAKPDWEIISMIGKKFLKDYFRYETPSQIMSELAEAYPSYKGISFEKIGSFGIQKMI